MNKIVNNKDTETSYKVNTRKGISIPLIPLLIILIVIFIFIVKIYSTTKVIASTDNISNESITTKNKSNNTEEILIGLQDEVNDTSTNEESNIVEKTNNIQQPNTPKVTTYTASDGKKYDIV